MRNDTIVKLLMYAYGDDIQPLEESIKVMDEIVTEYVFTSTPSSFPPFPHSYPLFPPLHLRFPSPIPPSISTASIKPGYYPLSSHTHCLFPLFSLPRSLRAAGRGSKPTD